MGEKIRTGDLLITCATGFFTGCRVEEPEVPRLKGLMHVTGRYRDDCEIVDCTNPLIEDHPLRGFWVSVAVATAMPGMSASGFEQAVRTVLDSDGHVIHKERLLVHIRYRVDRNLGRVITGIGY